MTSKTLYIVVCGAPLASRAGDGVRAARAAGWDPYLIPTDAALPWLADQDLGDAPLITGSRTPDQPKRTPPADAVAVVPTTFNTLNAVVPTTFNTLNAWANGNAHTYPLTTLCAALGSRTPTVAVPFAKHELTGHPAWLASLAVLRYAGVGIVDPHDGSAKSLAPVVSGSGQAVTAAFEWKWVLDRIACDDAR